VTGSVTIAEACAILPRAVIEAEVDRLISELLLRQAVMEFWRRGKLTDEQARELLGEGQ
jgi:hypothetical protein